MTLERIRPHLTQVGITRIADITGLDRLGIPVFNAVAPRSNDVVSVYSGKGVTPTDSRVSAIMEAVERFSGALPMRPEAVASYHDLAQAGRRVLDPNELCLALLPTYRNHVPVYWTTGYDLLNEESILVPHCAVSYAYDRAAPRCFRLATANGLAAGNSIEEAICHALTELVERDAHTMADLLCSQLPYALTNAKGPVHAALAQPATYRHIDLDTLPEYVSRFVARFYDASVDLGLVNITSDIDITTVLAVSHEDTGPTTSKAHAGVGASLNPEVALVRAVTECAQSRAVDIQATREDIATPGTGVPPFQLFARRLSTVQLDAWPWASVGEPMPASDLPSRMTDDVMADIEAMLDLVRGRGVSRVIAVDVSPPAMPVRVARVLAPGLESWATDRSKLGARATSAWNAAVRRVAAAPAVPTPEGAGK